MLENILLSIQIRYKQIIWMVLKGNLNYLFNKYDSEIIIFNNILLNILKQYIALVVI